MLDTITWYRIVQSKHNSYGSGVFITKITFFGPYRVLAPDIAYDLDFIILASSDNCQWSRYQRDLVG